MLYVLIFLQDNPANGIAQKLSVQNGMFKKHWVQELCHIVTAKMCAGMQDAIRYNKEKLS